MTAMIVGTALALLALAYVLYPLYAGTKPGAPAGDGRMCSKCGMSAEDGSTYCSSCGSPLVASS